MINLDFLLFVQVLVLQIGSGTKCHSFSDKVGVKLENWTLNSSQVAGFVTSIQCLAVPSKYSLTYVSLLDFHLFTSEFFSKRANQSVASSSGAPWNTLGSLILELAISSTLSLIVAMISSLIYL